MKNHSFEILHHVERGPTVQSSDIALGKQQWTRALSHAEQEVAQSAPGTAKAYAHLTAARAQWHLDEFLPCLQQALLSLRNRDSETPASVAVHSMTLAAFALNEMGAMEEARSLAWRALAMTRVESLFELLPTALSCAAHVEACSGDLDRAEAFHTEALSHAQQAADKDPLQMTLDNVLLSYVEILRRATRQDDLLQVESVKQRSRRHIAQAMRLSIDPELSQWRRLSLQQSLGEFMGLSGELEEGERLLGECLAQSSSSTDSFSTQSTATALAELLESRGAHEQALAVLQAHVQADGTSPGSFRRRIVALRTTASCLRQLGRSDAAAIAAEDVAEELRKWEALREDAIRYVSGDGPHVGAAV